MSSTSSSTMHRLPLRVRGGPCRCPSSASTSVRCSMPRWPTPPSQRQARARRMEALPRILVPLPRPARRLRRNKRGPHHRRLHHRHHQVSSSLPAAFPQPRLVSTRSNARVPRRGGPERCFLLRLVIEAAGKLPFLKPVTAAATCNRRL